MSDYWRRVADAQLQRSLAALGGVLIDGPRACGKSETALHHAASFVRLDTDPQIRELAQLLPQRVLEGRTPRSIDEWQLAPNLFNSARALIDERRAPGQFIFSGSATPPDDVTRHTGAGRFARVRMRPMSLFESRDSTAQVSFAELIEGHAPGGVLGPTVPHYAELIVRGGWPALATGVVNDASQFLAAYVDSMSRADALTGETSRNPMRMLALMRALARNCASETSQARLAQEAEISQISVRSYLDTLSRLFVLEEQPAWSPRLRSSVRKRVRPKWHFVDPSIAAHLLAASPERLLSDLETMGFLFESLCVRDLRVYSEPLNGTVLHYRDENGLEIDSVVQFTDGSWAAFEVKLGGGAAIEAGCANLKRLSQKVSDDERGRMRGLTVLYAGSTSYRRPDGVNVVSLGHLAP